MTDATSIPLEPIFTVLQPYIISVLGVIVTSLIGMAAAKWNQVSNIKISDSNVARLQNAAKNQAGALVAAAEDNLKMRSISVDSPSVVTAARAIEAHLPEIVKAVAPAPGALETMIAGEIGRLQAAQAPTPPQTVIVSAPAASSKG